MRALITGTSSGIGRATAERFLSDGIEVVGLDIKAPAVFRDGYTHVVCDVSVPSSLSDVGEFDYVVNNAGTIDEATSIAVNLEGYVNVAEKYAFTPAIKALTNVGSISGRVGLDTMRYCASQGGRVSLTKHLAIRLGNLYHARVNCVSFGAVLTGLEPYLYERSELVEAVANENLLKKWITVDEAAEWVYFVTVANKSMTGQEILIDNGEEANYNFIDARAGL